MKRERDEIESEGSITVFLSLILLLILSLLFTIIEGARIATGKVYADRTVSTAMDSVLAEFYGPLWEEYHIFGLDIGYGTKIAQKEVMTARLEDYISYTFTPNRNMNLKYFKKDLELYDISVDSISVTEQTKLMDYQGELLINEAVEFMKYREMGDTIELLLEKLSLLQTPGKVSVLYEEKHKVEEELVEIDEGILELMELLDGLKTGKKGIELQKDGTFKTSEVFIKKICFQAVTKETVGINQDNIFLALKNKYVNPAQDIEYIIERFSNIELSSMRVEELEAQQKETSIVLQKEQDKLKELNSIVKKTKEIRQQVKDTRLSIEKLNNQDEELQKEITKQKEQIRQFIAEIKIKKKEISQLMKEIKPFINLAKATLDQIIQKAGKAEVLIEQYENSLYREKEELGKDVFAGLEDNLKELKQYTVKDKAGYNFSRMKEILEHNLSVLIQVENYLGKGETKLMQEDYQNAKDTIQKAGNSLKAYQINGLTLDYSTLVLNQSKNPNPLGKVGALLQEELTGLVMDSSIISNAEITQEILPSIIASISGEEAGFLSGITSFFDNAAIGGNNSGMGNLFGSFGEGTQAMSFVGDSVNTIAKHVLYQEYLKEHFEMFPKEGEDIKARKPAVLAYEQEYLLAGKSSDQENLSSLISRIIFIRTIMDFVSLLGDKTKCNEAKLVATSLVGFTGLPILVSITQTLILLIWSFAEALVDTSAMMMGREVPILKKKIILEFSDLFLLNQAFLKTKAIEIAKTKELAFSYHDYLRVFLLVKNKQELAYRSMDLMQENIQIRYEDNFMFQNCLFGYMLKADYSMKPKLMGISFVQRYLSSRANGFRFFIEKSYSY